MNEPLWVLPGLPLLGFLILSLFGTRLSQRVVGAIGTGSIALSFAAAVALVWAGPSTESLGTWMRVGDLTVGFGLRLDPLSACFALVVTGVGALIHWSATEYMYGDQGYVRFFAWMNFFVAAMLALVLADDLLGLFIGWEGVGLASWALIGHWYEDPANGAAARKAFVVTRIGDAALMVALFQLATALGTLHLPEVLEGARGTWAPGSPTAVAVAVLVLLGAVGKSAQVPLQTWLPDAMAGPTPVSALLHAATMVTAGVYLVARTHALFELAPIAMVAVATVGAASLLVGGVSALFQRDIKRVLAYSTMSQIGYMFLALGVGAYQAAIFHFVTHALFKALLFLAAGGVILAVDHEQDLMSMGGLGRKLPVTFATFVVGALGLSGAPLITGGYYSKEAIRGAAAGASTLLWGFGVLGALLTALYTFRMVILAFLGPMHHEVHHRPGVATTVPLVTLAVGSILAAGLWGPLQRFLEPALPPLHEAATALTQPEMAAIVSAASLGGIALAFWRFAGHAPGGEPDLLTRFARGGLGFDGAYDLLVVRPLERAGIANRRDLVDRAYEGLAEIAEIGNEELVRTENGRLRTYALVTVAGAAALVGLALWSAA